MEDGGISWTRFRRGALQEGVGVKAGRAGLQNQPIEQ